MMNKPKPVLINYDRKTMYLHKENRELFRDAILLTSQKLAVSEEIVEKDYYDGNILL